jgi:hypothetical protein
LADVVILAILALEVTAGKKDGSRTAPAPQGILFAQMGTITTYLGSLAGAAYAHLAGTPINATFPRAYIADGKMFVGQGNAPSQLPAVKKPNICRLKAVFMVLPGSHHLPSLPNCSSI